MKTKTSVVLIASLAALYAASETMDKAEIGSLDGGVFELQAARSEDETVIWPSLAIKDKGGQVVATYKTIEYRFADGGYEKYDYLVEPDCVRRRADSGTDSCRRLSKDGGSYDFGELNRFPKEESTGKDCEAVSCAVILGDNADE